MLKVLTSGPQTTIQDHGRLGLRGQGIATSGAADRLSYALANFCVGNRWNAPALECPLGGLSLRIDQPIHIAITGGCDEVFLDDKPVASHKAHSIKAGTVLHIPPFKRGATAYIAFSGGLDVSEIMGSASTYLPAGFGGHKGRALKPGDKLHCVKLSSELAIGALPAGYIPPIGNLIVLRVCHGPEFGSLSPQSQIQLTKSGFTASRATDRMGSRLDGPHLSLETTQSLVSSAILPGTLQVPPDGTPILLLADGHCTGGYVRALSVIRADLWQLGQIRAGTQIRFQHVSRDNALDILKKRTAFYNALIPDFHF